MNLEFNDGNIIQQISTALNNEKKETSNNNQFYHDVLSVLLSKLNSDDVASLAMTNKSLLKNCSTFSFNSNLKKPSTPIQIEQHKKGFLNKLKTSAVSLFNEPKKMRPSEVFPDSRPFTRWWWLNGPFTKVDIKAQLIWMKKQGFGGVELAWLYPSWDDRKDSLECKRMDWLSEDFKKTITYTKKCAEKLGLGCDFTLGSAWPFGGSFLEAEDCSQTFTGPSLQAIEGSWESPKHTPVLNHLSKKALQNYVDHMRNAFEPALKGRPSSLFCDSLEISNDTVWNEDLWKKFEDRFGYCLRNHLNELETNPHIRYDSRKILSEAILKNFYEPFTALSNQMGAKSRVQCHGAPTDLLSAYAFADVPESESLLFDPWFSRIPASATCLSGRSVTSCETFTCIYGFRRKTNGKEQILDLKLLYDAVLANGVNQIVWHGMPYNPINDPINKFFASVHVGPDANFVDQLPKFNQYMATTCNLMRLGVNAHRMAVYLPNEDMMMLGELPDEYKKRPGALSHWEMRFVQPKKETTGYFPVWLSGDMLSKVKIVDGNLCCGDMNVPYLYIDVEWLDIDAVSELLRLVKEGGKIILNNKPKQPGFIPHDNYEVLLKDLMDHKNTLKNLKEADVTPLLQGKNLPNYWAREYKGELYLFLAHPSTKDVKYPMRYCQFQESKNEKRNITINHGENTIHLDLEFEANESIMLKIGTCGKVTKIALDADFEAHLSQQDS